MDEFQTEIARDSSISAVSEFDRGNLKKAETAEKNPLPSTEAIAQEMEHIKFKARKILVKKVSLIVF